MTVRRVGLGLAIVLGLVGGSGPAAAQEGAALQVRGGGPAEGWRAVVTAERLLEDPALRGALASGLPLRFHLRVELWRKAFFDRLEGVREVNLALVQDPIDRAFTLDDGRAERRFTTPAAAQEALAAALRVALRPGGRGRFYYLATLEVETLSLSDLEELRRWLRGEVQPAVQGRAPPGRAVESGLRRVLVRVIGLPTRRYEARSGTFTLK